MTVQATTPTVTTTPAPATTVVAPATPAAPSTKHTIKTGGVTIIQTIENGVQTLETEFDSSKIGTDVNSYIATHQFIAGVIVSTVGWIALHIVAKFL